MVRAMRCAPALSCLRHGAAKGVSTLRASIAIAVGSDMQLPHRKLYRSLGLLGIAGVVVALAPVPSWLSTPIICSYLILAAGAAMWLSREVEWWMAFSRQCLDDLERDVAQGIAAQSGETEGLDPEGKSPVREADAP